VEKADMVRCGHRCEQG